MKYYTITRTFRLGYRRPRSMERLLKKILSPGFSDLLKRHFDADWATGLAFKVHTEPLPDSPIHVELTDAQRRTLVDAMNRDGRINWPDAVTTGTLKALEWKELVEKKE